MSSTVTPKEPVPETIDELCALIEAADADLHKRLRAVSALGDKLSGDSAVPAAQSLQGMQCLMSRLRHEKSVSVLVHVISVLSRVKAQASVGLLMDVLLATQTDIFENPPEGEKPSEFRESDEAVRLRSAAAQALGRLGDDRAIVPLMSILNDKSVNYRLRLAAAESLGKLGDEHAMMPLLEIIRDEREKSLYLKESAVKALGMLGDIRAIEPLIDVLESKRGIKDKFNFLKEQIIEAIGRIGQPSRKATDTLIAALTDPASSIRLAAVEALGELGDQACLAELKMCVFDKDDDVAKAAIYAVYRLCGESGVRQLLTMDNLPQFLREEIESYIP